MPCTIGVFVKQLYDINVEWMNNKGKLNDYLRIPQFNYIQRV